MSVIWHVTMSVDGFIAGPDHEMEWAFGHGGASAMAEDVMRSTGAILAGRRWYDVATARYNGVDGIYGGRWSGSVFVLTHRPAEADDVTFLTRTVPDAVSLAEEAAAGMNVEIFGADVARQVVQAGLLDEIVIHLAPVLLGDGIRFYAGDMVELEQTEVARSGQLTDLRYGVRRAHC